VSVSGFRDPGSGIRLATFWRRSGDVLVVSVRSIVDGFPGRLDDDGG
jgi:hypothetical protein